MHVSTNWRVNRGKSKDSFPPNFSKYMRAIMRYSRRFWKASQIFWKRERAAEERGQWRATEREKRCETGLRRAAIVPSLLPTILPEYFQFISKSNNRSSFARNRENSKENRENPSLPLLLSPLLPFSRGR